MAVKKIDKRINLERDRAICESYLSGKTTYEVSDDFGVSRPVVCKVLKRHGINARETWLSKAPERFWEKVCAGSKDECWPWQGSISRLGYGHFGWRGKVTEAHRVAYEIWHGVKPGDKHVLHTCDNRRCCNPHHLYLGTHKDNMRDMVERGRARNGETGPHEHRPWQ